MNNNTPTDEMKKVIKKHAKKVAKKNGLSHSETQSLIKITIASLMGKSS
jgi:hypothetical protein